VLGSICEYRDAEFSENAFPMKTCAPYVLPATPTLPASTACTSNNNKIVELKCSKMPRFESSFGPDFVTIFRARNGDISYLDDMNKNFVRVFILEEDPQAYDEAMRSIDSKF